MRNTPREYYEAGQLSVYARMIREKKITVDQVAEMTNREFAQQAKSLSHSRQCIDGPWEFQNQQKIRRYRAMQNNEEKQKLEGRILKATVEQIEGLGPVICLQVGFRYVPDDSQNNERNDNNET